MAFALLLSVCGTEETSTPEPTIDFVSTLTASPPTVTFTALPTITPASVDGQPKPELTTTPIILYDEDGNSIKQNSTVQVDPLGDCYRLAILQDSGDKKALPGEAFTVSWTVQNVGYCEREPDFKAVWGLGEKMGNPSTHCASMFPPAKELLSLLT